MMSLMNTTIQIASLYDCDQLSQYTGIVNSFDPIWRQTIAGCNILNILRDMYGFKVSYVFEDLEANLVGQRDPKHISSTIQNRTIDMYLRPMSLRVQHLKDMAPLQAAYSWKLGFLLRRRDQHLYSRFYSKPFSRPVWNCLYFTALFISILFYFLKKWEFSVIGGWECSYPYELLMVIGGYCQHIPPIEATLPSRRIAYFSFLIFAYTVYTYYTSNLLSDLVNDKGDVITLTSLVKTDIEYVIVDYMTLTISENVPTTEMHYGLITEKLRNLRSVSLLEGLQGVKAGTFALLSDYTSIYPIVKKTFDNEEVCDIMSVDLFSQIKKYFFVSKRFAYKEQFKIGALRAKEVGIFKRLLATDYEELDCLPAALVQTSITQISVPILILLTTYVSSVLILFAERAYYKRNHKLWPYVE